jgi:glycosyltransferase involved in cell wall biosynthesis
MAVANGTMRKLKTNPISKHHHNKVDFKPLVSVVMSTFNGQQYISQQLDTIIAQTYPAIEIVIVDDASTDNSFSIAQEYQARDQRIKLFRNEKNLGPNKSFEKGIGLASGEYIAISDQDDIWELNKIETMLLKWPPTAQFVYTIPGQFNDNDFDSRKPVRGFHHSDMNNLHKLVFNTPISGHASMFKKELVKRCTPFPSDIYYDWWISMHAAKNGLIGFIPETLTWQRIHARNFSLQVYKLADKKEKQARLRKQWAYFIRTFFEKESRNTEESRSLMRYATLLAGLDGHRFSAGMFWYILKHRKLVFHYKHKPFVLISHIKHALRMARSGVIS